MFRWVIPSVVLGTAAAAAVIYFVGWPQGPGRSGHPLIKEANAGDSKPSSTPAHTADLGERLQVAFHKAEASDPAPPSSGVRGRTEDIVIPECRFSPKTTAEIPSEREGTLLFVATEVSPFDEKHPEYARLFKVLEDGRYEFIGDKVDPDNKGKYFSWDLPTVAVLVRDTDKEIKPSERVFPPSSSEKDKPERVFRRAREGDLLEPERFIIFREKRYLRELGKTDKVKEGDLLAVINPALVYDELLNKDFTLRAKVADRDSSIAIRDEAENRWKRDLELFRSSQGKAITQQDVDGDKMNFLRYKNEVFSKEALIRVAQQELSQTLTLLRMHFIRAKIDGSIMQIYRRKGEAVKSLEQVLQLNNLDRLVIEGQVGVQYLPYLKDDQIVTIEPSVQERYLQVLPGHPAEITGVAVSNDADHPQIVSASEDGSIRVWAANDKGRFVEVDSLAEPGAPARAVTCVACSPIDCGEKLCVTGDADGNVKLWDLSKKGKEAFITSWRAHKNAAVTCVAFHFGVKKGTKTKDDDVKHLYFASGGEDRRIVLWHKQADAWDQIQVIPDAHKGAITSIQFGAGSCVSTGTDKQLIHWEVYEKALKVSHRFEHRGGDVGTLGVSADGSRALFDKSRELQLLSLEHRRTEAVLQTSTGAAGFNNLALFSPDGKMILTGQGPDAHLRLWHVPVDDPRAFEIRQFVWEGSATTCAAFSPHKDRSRGFVVSGTRDGRVLIWPLPTSDEIAKPIKARLIAREQTLASSTHEIRIQAEIIDNPTNLRLVPGNTATIVAKP